MAGFGGGGGFSLNAPPKAGFGAAPGTGGFGAAKPAGGGFGAAPAAGGFGAVESRGGWGVERAPVARAGATSHRRS